MNKIFLIIGLALNLLMAHSQPKEKRVALVIGNEAYKYGGELTNTKKDAKVIEDALIKLDFDVSKVINASDDEMRAAFLEYIREVETADVGLIYYSGHGIQINGVNYLIPVNVNITDQYSAKSLTFNINDWISQLEVDSDKLNIIILDACRNNRFKAFTKSGRQGLCEVKGPSGTLVAFATLPETIALDNGLYATTLATEMLKPQRIEDVFYNTRKIIEKETAGQQCPIEVNRLNGAFYLNNQPFEKPLETKEEKYLKTNRRKKDNLPEAISQVVDLLEEEARKAFGKKSYASALKFLEEVIFISKLADSNTVIAPVHYYNIGVAASFSGDTIKAVESYEKALELNYEDPDLYVILKNIYFSIGDTTKGVKIIEMGFEKFPGNQTITFDLINYYLVKDENEKALKLLISASKEDPNNISLIFAQATIYDKLGDLELAESTYLKCIDLNPTYFDAFFNLGVMHYNHAIEIYQSAGDILDNNEYYKMLEKGNEVLTKSLPYFEQAHEIAPNDLTTMESLKTIYFRLKMSDSYNAIKKEIEQFK